MKIKNIKKIKIGELYKFTNKFSVNYNEIVLPIKLTYNDPFNCLYFYSLTNKDFFNLSEDYIELNNTHNFEKI